MQTNGIPSPAQVAAANKRVPRMMGMTEVAEELGVSAKNLGKVANLPASAQTIAAGRLWRADVIEAFAAGRRKAKA